MRIIHISIPSLFIETTVKLNEMYYFIWGDIASDDYPPFEREIVLDDDINNDVNLLYVEIIDKNRSYYRCTICGRKL